MPLSEEPVTIHGGCNCGAVRYVVNVPRWSERSLTPYRTAGADVGDTRLPEIAIDHCNDCRRATGAFLPGWMITETKTVRASLLPRAAQAENRFHIPDGERNWLPGDDIFNFRSSVLKESYMTVYKSSPQRSRFFCSRCGTNLAYVVDEGSIPPEWGWPKMIDILLGTIDREDLEKEHMAFTRMLWCAMGVPWIRQFASNGGGGIPEHPLAKADYTMDDDWSEDWEKMKKFLGKS